MTTNDNETDKVMLPLILKLFEDYGIDVITPISVKNLELVGEIRISSEVREIKISNDGKQVHKSIYADALLHENNIFKKHHNKEVFIDQNSSSNLRQDEVNLQNLKSVPKNVMDVDEAIKNKYVLRLFYKTFDELRADFKTVYYFLDANLETIDTVYTLGNALGIKSDGSLLKDEDIPF